jgi:hypothetical protein
MAKLPKTTLSGLSDAPIMNRGEDTLNMRAYAEALADFTRTCKTPMTISIQGDWGSGKSSIMHMIQSEITTDPGKKGTAKTIWFDTWQFAQFGSGDTLPITLLATFIRQLEGGSKAKDSLGREALSLVTKLFHSPVGKTVIRAGTAGIMNVDDWSKSEANGPLPSEVLSELREKLEQLLQQEGRVVFFVDDLDRIPPVQAVTLLETIKIFLNVENVVFILALDYEVVERGLFQKFGISSADLGGRSFFDKLIQLPFSIPVGSYKVKEYLRSALLELGYLDQKEGDNVGQVVPLVERSVGRNPRAIKRILNSLHLLRLIKEKVGDQERGKTGLETPLDALELDLAVLCLQSQFEPVYNWLSRSGDVKDKLKRMMDQETREDSEGTTTGPDSYQVSLERMFRSSKENPDRLAQERSRYETFKDTFLRVVGIGEDADEGDAKTIEPRVDYLARTLDLTRVTSSSAEPKLDSEVSAGPTDREVRRILREIARSTKPDGFWGCITSLHSTIASAPHRPIKVRQKDSENAVRFQFGLARLPADVIVHIWDNRVQVGLQFDGRTMRNPENRDIYLKRVQACASLKEIAIEKLTTDDMTSDYIAIRSVPFLDSSTEAIRAREPELIALVVDFLATLHNELPTDQLKA